MKKNPTNEERRIKIMEKITIENYQENAMRTCLPSAKNWGYATHNYRAELFELLAKIESFQAKQIRDGVDFDKAKYLDKIKDELGDCYWQLALFCELCKAKFIACFYKKEEAAYNKEIIIDGDVDVLNEFGRINFIVRKFDFDILDILQRNIDKLASRQERGVLKGSGDDR